MMSETNDSAIIADNTIDEKYLDNTNLINKENLDVEMQVVTPNLINEETPNVEMPVTSPNVALTINQKNTHKTNECLTCCFDCLSLCKYIIPIILVAGIYMLLYTVGYYVDNMNCDHGEECMPFLHASFFSLVIVPFLGLFCIGIVVLLLAIIVTPIIWIGYKCYE